ncbi:transcriptional regulator, LuxR family protein [Pseudomonas savastanoi pv. glycinea str. race 4]|nr:transcriptional regulator, LuxR family protein [Pseudomonas savastanoi pv. glycinea str. race 4]
MPEHKISDSLHIAMILCLKERTIHFHIASAIQKMGVCNKTAAAVQAALSGVF